VRARATIALGGEGMTKEATKIFFVTWPDGKIMEGSQTSTREDIAIARAIMNFLPQRWFPDLGLGSLVYGPMENLWRSMKKAGFKVQSIDTNCEGVSY
jgi:hypothetical protein